MENEKDEGLVLGGNRKVDEKEEEKMEAVFQLIRRFQEARKRHGNESKRKTKVRKLNGEKASWLPSFEWEDFKYDIQFRRPPLIFPFFC